MPHKNDIDTDSGEPAEALAEVASAPRRFGFLKGRIERPDDFATMGQAEIEEMFYGSSDEQS